MIFGYIYGGEVAKWLSDVLGQNLDLACFADEFTARKLKDMKKNHQLNLKDDDETVYADYSQLMLLSEASMKDLNTRTPYPISFWNFRPNIIVSDCEKYSEVRFWLWVMVIGTYFSF
jgi:uncharacterized protein YcbX